jgi:hypothetical protein
MSTIFDFIYILIEIFAVIFGLTLLADMILLPPAMIKGLRSTKSFGGVFISVREAIRSSPRLVFVRKIQLWSFIAAIIATVLLVISSLV